MYLLATNGCNETLIQRFDICNLGSKVQSQCQLVVFVSNGRGVTINTMTCEFSKPHEGTEVKR